MLTCCGTQDLRKVMSDLGNCRNTKVSWEQAEQLPWSVRRLQDPLVSQHAICRVWHRKRTWTCPYLPAALSEGGSVGSTIAFSLSRGSTNSSCQHKCSLNNDKLHICCSISHHSCCEPVLHQVATVKIPNTELAVLLKRKLKKTWSLTQYWGDGDPQARANTHPGQSHRHRVVCFSGLRLFRIKQMNYWTATPDHAQQDHFSLPSRHSKRERH